MNIHKRMLPPSSSLAASSRAKRMSTSQVRAMPSQADHQFHKMQTGVQKCQSSMDCRPQVEQLSQQDMLLLSINKIWHDKQQRTIRRKDSSVTSMQSGGAIQQMQQPKRQMSQVINSNIERKDSQSYLIDEQNMKQAGIRRKSSKKKMPVIGVLEALAEERRASERRASEKRAS